MKKVNIEKLAYCVSLEGPLRDFLDHLIERPSLEEFIRAMGVAVEEIFYDEEDFDFRPKAEEVYNGLRAAERELLPDHARMDQRTRIAMLFLPAVHERAFEWEAPLAAMRADDGR